MIDVYKDGEHVRIKLEEVYERPVTIEEAIQTWAGFSRSILGTPWKMFDDVAWKKFEHIVVKKKPYTMGQDSDDAANDNILDKLDTPDGVNENDRKTLIRNNTPDLVTGFILYVWFVFWIGMISQAVNIGI